MLHKNRVEKLEDFLGEFKKLLEKHNAAIVRSANSSNDLVVSIACNPTENIDAYFSEEISPDYIQNGWYTV